MTAEHSAVDTLLVT